MTSELIQPDPPGADPKSEKTREYLVKAAQDLRQLAAAMDALVDQPGSDQQHWYAEGVRIAARVEEVGLVARDNLATVAVTQPHAVPIQRIARVAGMNVNTLRKRIGRDLPPEGDDSDQAPY